MQDVKLQYDWVWGLCVTHKLKKQIKCRETKRVKGLSAPRSRDKSPNKASQVNILEVAFCLKRLNLFMSGHVMS